MKKEKKDFQENQNLNNSFKIALLFIGCLIGVLVVFMLQAYGLLDKLQISNYISLIAIGIDLGIVVLIGLFYNKSFSDKREIKNFLIEELKNFHVDYKEFANNVYRDNIDGQMVNNWFKLSNMKLDNLIFFLNSNLNIRDKRLKQEILKLRDLITQSPSFNNSFSSKKLKLSYAVKSNIISNNKVITHIIFDIILKVNKA